MIDKAGNWAIGLTYIVSVAAIWIAASFVVQSVVDAGISPFLITYICNSLFVVYIPIVEIGRYLEDSYGSLWFWRSEKESSDLEVLGESEQAILLEDNDASNEARSSLPDEELVSQKRNSSEGTLPDQGSLIDDLKSQLDAKGRWTRYRVAKVSLLICPFWFFAQLTFNLSLKYTTVTSNTILSSASSLFTFLVSLAFLGEKFTWIKLFGVLLCMGGTIIVEPFHSLTWKQLGLIIGKGLLDNVLSDYLWAKAVLLTSTTVATAGLTVQVPLAAIIDSLTGHAPGLLDCLGAVAVMIGFAGINVPSDAFKKSREASVELENECVNSTSLPTSQHSGAMS
ncbi:hypothetical protein K1719_013027 [Acacia pycnantha]|nr:hypothetical protein K1719_013027 [Acacia pycnantha]